MLHATTVFQILTKIACHFAISLVFGIRTVWFWGEGVLATK